MRAPSFPPLLSGHAVAAGEDPAVAAMVRAEAGEADAGDLFWAIDDATARCAVVLEPETDAATALCMVPLAMVAAADSLGAIGEANLAITHRWPSTIFANGAVVGGVGMQFPAGARADAVPPFAVLSMHVAVKWPRALGVEPGEQRDRTVLHEEGCGGIGTADVLESWSRHFLTWIDTWEDRGFRTVGEAWLYRAQDRDMPVKLETAAGAVEGTLAGIDDTGGALVRQGETMRLVGLDEIFFQGAAT